MRRVRTSRHAVVTVLACLTLAGCSSTGAPHAAPVHGSTVPVAASPVTSVAVGPKSTADYVAEANAICSAGTERSDALGDGPGDPGQATTDTLALFVPYLTAQAGVLSDELAKLRALPLPPGGLPDAASAYAHVATLLAHLDAAIAAARAGDLSKYDSELMVVVNETDAADQAALAAGLTACSN